VTKLDKLRKRILSRPRDFTWQELNTLMKGFGFELTSVGGSGRKFVHPDHNSLFLHEPHPGNVLKSYQVRDVLDLLMQEGLL
jgi:predicted RNA binding protein YcfA (HicA-like mRNA interferase family)